MTSCTGSKSGSSRSVAMVMSFVGSAAPIAAFVAITRRRADRSCTARRPERSGGRRAEAFLSREECRRQPAGEESRKARRCGTGLPAVRSPSRRPGRGLFRSEGHQGDRPRSDSPCPSLIPSRPSSEAMKRTTSCGASCWRTDARSSSIPSRRRSSLKSSKLGDRPSVSIPAAVGAIAQTRHRGIAGRIAVAGDVETAQCRWEAAGRRGGWPRAPRPSAGSAGSCAATAWSRCLRPRPSRRWPRQSGRHARGDGPWPVAAKSMGALSRPDGSSQVRCAPVILPPRSVTAAIRAGQVSVGLSSSGR